MSENIKCHHGDISTTISENTFADILDYLNTSDNSITKMISQEFIVNDSFKDT